MNILHKPLFFSSRPRALGVGFHNIGSGILRASNETMVKEVELHYGERCGHLPLDATSVRVLVHFATPEISTQLEYLSRLFGKDITPITFDEFKEASRLISEPAPLVVPYVNVPEIETSIQNDLAAESWGIPGIMTHVLKNKADFYQLVDELGEDVFSLPDYKIVNIQDVARETYAFLGKIEEIYKKAGCTHYPLGVMLRTAESDGNYGCCIAYEHKEQIIVIQNGDVERVKSFLHWPEALAASQELLAATMNVQKEARVVISRYIDVMDSPGMSVVIMDGQVESLRWNGQLQKKGSKACIGTSAYIPESPYLQQVQQQYEDQAASFFATFLRKTAEKCGIDFASIRGIANVDIMLPGELEKELQKQRKQMPTNYLAECNPRWTNYTDAIMTILGASGKEQTIQNMKTVIQEGICTVDKYTLPENVDPKIIRECIFERDAVLTQYGTRIICRMAKNPMGLIFAGNVKQAQQELATLLYEKSQR